MFPFVYVYIAVYVLSEQFQCALGVFFRDTIVSFKT